MNETGLIPLVFQKSAMQEALPKRFVEGNRCHRKDTMPLFFSMILPQYRCGTHQRGKKLCRHVPADDFSTDIVLFLKIEADPKLGHPTGHHIPIEWLVELPPLQSLHEFEMNGKTQKEGLKSESERSYGLIFIEDRNIVLIQPFEAIKLSRVSLHFRAPDV
jgi:hypothetical protein